MKIDLLNKSVGAKISEVDLRNLLNQEEIDFIKNTWYTHGVLCFPNQILDEIQQIKFGEYFGELAHTQGEYAISKSHPAIMYITNEKENGKYVGALPDGEMYFHTDMCYVEKPSMATFLYAINIPKIGGNTIFSNMYMAYDSLDDEIKSRIKDLKAINSYEPGSAAPTIISRKNTHRSKETKSFAQPMICTHPVTKKKALYVNRLMTESIVGLSSQESDDLLNMLFNHQENKKFMYEHIWSIGDLLIWDNRCVLHARTNFDASELRKLRRITVKGDVIQ